MVYARYGIVEVGAVTAVHYLLRGTILACPLEFQSLHLCRHLNVLEETESDVGMIPCGNSYIAFDSTANYFLRPFELGKETLYDYKENLLLSRDIPKDIDGNENCLRVRPDNPFCETKIAKRTKK